LASTSSNRRAQNLRRRLKRLAKRALSPRWLYLLRGTTSPISARVGTDRGTPVDRFFIERFLSRHAHRIRDAVLEVKDGRYTTRYGGTRVTRSDILDVNRENKDATILADIRDLNGIPDEAYDCFIITQVFQYVDDLDAAIRASRRVLKAGGCLLVTAPTLGKLDGQEDNVVGNYWRLTCDSARYLFGKHFPPERLEIQAWGNILVATSILQGLALEEIARRKLEYFDSRFPCGVTICAIK